MLDCSVMGYAIERKKEKKTVRDMRLARMCVCARGVCVCVRAAYVCVCTHINLRVYMSAYMYMCYVYMRGCVYVGVYEYMSVLVSMHMCM